MYCEIVSEETNLVAVFSLPGNQNTGGLKNMHGQTLSLYIQAWFCMGPGN